VSGRNLRVHTLSEIFGPLTWFAEMLEIITYTSLKIWRSVGKETDAEGSDNRDHLYLHENGS
jgi:hypothetical protein